MWGNARSSTKSKYNQKRAPLIFNRARIYRADHMFLAVHSSFAGSWARSCRSHFHILYFGKILYIFEIIRHKRNVRGAKAH